MKKVCGNFNDFNLNRTGCGVVFTKLESHELFSDNKKFRTINKIPYCRDCYQRRTNTKKAEKAGIGEKKLMIAVLIQAMKDYSTACRNYKKAIELADEEKTNESLIQMNTIKNWINNESGTFPIVSMAWNKSHEVAREYVIKKMKAIENGEALKSHEVKKYESIFN